MTQNFRLILIFDNVLRSLENINYVTVKFNVSVNC
jgi:hypothetical protein